MRLKKVHCPRCQIAYLKLWQPGVYAWTCNCGERWEVVIDRLGRFEVLPDPDATVHATQAYSTPLDSELSR